MKKKWLLFFNLLTVLFLLSWSQQTFAFSCTSNGVSIGGAGTFTVPVDVILNKTTSSIILTDMRNHTTCVGFKGYSDALQVTGAAISSHLTGIGFSGFINIFGSRYNFPLGTYCVWPDASCSRNFTDGINIPVNVQIGMQRTSFNNLTGITIPAGTEIARFSVRQRSISTWGWNKTWVFILKNKLVVPAYTCTIKNPNQTVNLPDVKATELKNNGAGRYPKDSPFSINLACDPETTVSVKFEGTKMTGKNDVLANISTGNENVGVQMLFKGNPVILGQNIQVINSSQNEESLPFSAYYFYNGAPGVHAGAVTATTTFTFTYQ